MSVWRGLPRRVFLAAGLCAGLGVAVTAAALMRLFLDLALQRISALLPELDAVELRLCERDPAAYGRELGPRVRLDVYDPATGAAARSDAGPLDRELLARLDAGEATPTRLYWFELWGGAGLRRLAPAGPCGLVMMRWQTAGRERMTMLAVIFGFIALSIGAAVALASFFAVRPLTVRLGRLRRAAQRVGVEAGYASAGDAVGDDLGQVSALLDGAHRRILADAEAMTRRQRALEQHLGAVAHDLRTPLASLQLTLEHLSTAPGPEHPALVRGALADVVYMAALTENLHLASRLADGADPLRGAPRVELGGLVDQVARRFGMLGRLRGIEVHGARPDAAVTVVCNPAMAEQALANLVHNAVAHGEPGGHVAVVLDVVGGRFTLTVVDDGPGVPPTDLPRLGERTFRSDDARRRDPEGSGLGLAISFEVCRRAGWTLELAAEAPRGLRATLRGPLDAGA